MLIIKLLNYLRGYVVVEVWGGFCERFINLCSRRKVPFWDLAPVEKGKIRVKLPARQFKKLRKIARDTGCSIKLIKKSGIVFSISKHKKRKLFLYGFIGFIIGLVLLSLFVWNIQISGDERISRQNILSNLKICGIYPGALRSSIDPEQVENDMLLKMPELSYIIINLKGSNVSVNVKKRVNPPEIIDKDTPCDIISDKTGVIYRILAFSGDPKVISGETIFEGQLLVSGTIVNKDQTYRYVHSRALIELRTWYEESQNTQVTRNIKEYTGESKSKSAINIGNLRINLYINSRIEYTLYDKIIENRKLSIWGIELPISLTRGQFNEYKLKRVSMPLDVVKDELCVLLRSRVLKQIGKGKIVSEEIKYDISGDIVTGHFSCECLETAGVQTPVKIGSEYGTNNSGGQN